MNNIQRKSHINFVTTSHWPRVSVYIWRAWTLLSPQVRTVEHILILKLDQNLVFVLGINEASKGQLPYEKSITLSRLIFHIHFLIQWQNQFHQE